MCVCDGGEGSAPHPAGDHQGLALCGASGSGPAGWATPNQTPSWLGDAKLNPKLAGRRQTKPHTRTTPRTHTNYTAPMRTFNQTLTHELHCAHAHIQPNVKTLFLECRWREYFLSHTWQRQRKRRGPYLRTSCEILQRCQCKGRVR